MKTLSELKRTLQKGIKLKMVYSDVTNNRLIGTEREISIVQTNAIALQTIKADGSICNSWFQYPKSSELEYDGNSFSIFENINDKRIKVLEYLIIN